MTNRCTLYLMFWKRSAIVILDGTSSFLGHHNRSTITTLATYRTLVSNIPQFKTFIIWWYIYWLDFLRKGGSHRGFLKIVCTTHAFQRTFSSYFCSWLLHFLCPSLPRKQIIYTPYFCLMTSLCIVFLLIWIGPPWLCQCGGLEFERYIVDIRIRWYSGKPFIFNFICIAVSSTHTRL